MLSFTPTMPWADHTCRLICILGGIRGQTLSQEEKQVPEIRLTGVEEVLIAKLQGIAQVLEVGEVASISQTGRIPLSRKPWAWTTKAPTLSPTTTLSTSPWLPKGLQASAGDRGGNHRVIIVNATESKK